MFEAFKLPKQRLRRISSLQTPQQRKDQSGKAVLNCRRVLFKEQTDIHCKAASAGGLDSPACENPLL